PSWRPPGLGCNRTFVLTNLWAGGVADPSLLRRGLRRVLADPELFSRHVLGLPLRPYQARVAHAVLDSVERRRGLTFTVMMARQCLAADIPELDRRGGLARLSECPEAQPGGLKATGRLELADGRWLTVTADTQVWTRRRWV